VSPNDLPHGWAQVPIAELLAPLRDGRLLHHGWSPQCEREPSPSEAEWGVRKTTAIQAGAFLPEHNKRLPGHLAPRPGLEVAPGDLLITCAGPRARCGVACLVRNTRRRLMMSGKMYRFRVPPAGVDARFLEAALQTTDAQRAIDGMKTGISDSGLNLTHDRFFQLPIRLAPLPEQSRIVAEIEKQLSRIDAAVAALKRAQENLKRYRASVLAAACSGRLVPTEAELARREGRSYEHAGVLLERILAEPRARWSGKGKYKEPARPDTTALPRLPEGWVWTTLAAIAEIKGGITKGQQRRASERLRRVPYLRVANVQRGYLDLSDVSEIEATDAEIEELHLVNGDVLFNEGGDRDKLGRGWVWEGRIPTCIHQNHVFRARIVGAAIAPRLLSWYGNSLGQQYFMAQGKQTTNLASINMSKLAKFPVPLPPVVEQARIVAEVDRRLSVVDVMKTEIETSLLRADRLRQSVLKRAFEGKLVPQDPDDEPASALLDRIRAERGAPDAAPRVGRGQRRRQVSQS
jgi:type I restriction enzyme, S subunit